MSFSITLIIVNKYNDSVIMRYNVTLNYSNKSKFFIVYFQGLYIYSRSSDMHILNIIHIVKQKIIRLMDM